MPLVWRYADGKLVMQTREPAAGGFGAICPVSPRCTALPERSWELLHRSGSSFFVYEHLVLGSAYDLRRVKIVTSTPPR